MKEQQGQIIVILLLVVVLALAIGLALVGRSLSEISNSRKSEDSSRAFSAAEAGIEQALLLNPLAGAGSQSENRPVEDLSNQSTASFSLYPNLTANYPGMALEVPPIGKESFAQFWLINPDTLSCILGEICEVGSDGSGFKMYFGIAKDYSFNLNDQPALQVKIILENSAGAYISKTYLYDSYALNGPSSRLSGFNGCDERNSSGIGIPTNNDPTDRYFYCRVDVVNYKGVGETPIMARARILYTSGSHPLALKPPVDKYLPDQVTIYKSTGTAGEIQRSLQVFKQKEVMPNLFDYALFSAGALSK